MARPSAHLQHGGLDFKEGTENSSYNLNDVDIHLPERLSFHNYDDPEGQQIIQQYLKDINMLNLGILVFF